MRFSHKSFFDVTRSYDEAEIALFSVAYDNTTSYRSGSKFAGQSIRSESMWGYETYSFLQNGDLENVKFADIGEIDYQFDNSELMIESLAVDIEQLFNDRKIPFMIGGEHSLSFAAIKAAHKFHPNLKVIQLDAHADLRDDYNDNKYSHASVMKRAADLIGIENIFQIGIRSGTKEEFDFASERGNLFPLNVEKFGEVCEKLKHEDVYVTIDLDILDPSVFPGTGTPEPGGITFKELEDCICKLSKIKNIVGLDVMELSPPNDPSQISTGAAIKAIRELLIMRGNNEIPKNK